MNHQTLFRRLPWPVAVIDVDLVVRDASETFAHRVSAVPEALAGRHLTDVLQGATEAMLREVRDAITSGESRSINGAAWGVAVRVVPAGGGEALLCLEERTPAPAHEMVGRLETLSAALRSIKHEINNPLTGALGNINMLLRREDWDEKTRKRLSTAEQEMKKISEIVVRLADLVPPPD